MDLSLRIESAEKLINKGQVAEKNGELNQAYELYTQAHDSILDCPRIHKKCHHHLWRINWKLNNIGELATDLLVLAFAPLGVFELVSYFSKTDAFGSDLCKR